MKDTVSKAVTSLPLQQSPQFAAALSAIGAGVASTSPVVLRRQIGPLSMTLASRVCASALSDPPRVVNAEFDTPIALRRLGYRRIITPAHVAEWDLTVPDLRAGLSGKWRNRLVRAEAHGLRSRITSWNGADHPMFDAATKLARARRFKSYPNALLAAFATLNRGFATISEAYDKGHLVAACLILRHGDRATYQTAWANGTGRALQAPRFVLWHAAQEMINQGVTLLDLGTVETENARGLARFKLGTGAQVRALGGTWLRLR